MRPATGILSDIIRNKTIQRSSPANKREGASYTYFQFKPKADEFTMGDEPPAYRWIDLHNDGRVDTGVKFLPSICANA